LIGIGIDDNKLQGQSEWWLFFWKSADHPPGTVNEDEDVYAKETGEPDL
jgi:hypothetical protein